MGLAFFPYISILHKFLLYQHTACIPRLVNSRANKCVLITRNTLLNRVNGEHWLFQSRRKIIITFYQHFPERFQNVFLNKKNCCQKNIEEIRLWRSFSKCRHLNYKLNCIYAAKEFSLPVGNSIFTIGNSDRSHREGGHWLLFLWEQRRVFYSKPPWTTNSLNQPNFWSTSLCKN